MTARHNALAPLTQEASPTLPEQLGAELARFEAVFQAFPVASAVFDGSLRLVRCNPRFRELTGLGDQDLAGCTLKNAFPNVLGDIDAVLQSVAQGSRRVERIALGFSSGPRVVEASFNPLAEHVGTGGVLVVVTDVTDQEMAVVQEGRAREKRLAAVGQLAAGVMHDVNNALNPIMAAAYLLDVHAEDPVAVRDYARRIAMAAETGAATAARVGRFIRQEPLQGGREELLNLDALADEVVAMTRPLWAERIESGRIRLDRASCGEARVRGIPGEVREALLNLVQNALDAMPSGGVLGISSGTSPDAAWIEVRDSGVGMSDEVRERAFEPFFTTKGRRGSGLGLAEVYGIMRRHRGLAEISSVNGAGVTVRLSFPRASTPMNEQLAVASRPRPRKILIVEDHEDGREFMRALLCSDGHVVEAVDGVIPAMEKLEFAAALPDGAFDVVVADIGLPDGSGWDLAREVRDRWPEMRIGVVTGWEPSSEPRTPVHFTLRKPVPAQELLRLVSEELVAPSV